MSDYELWTHNFEKTCTKNPKTWFQFPDDILTLVTSFFDLFHTKTSSIHFTRPTL